MVEKSINFALFRVSTSKYMPEKRLNWKNDLQGGRWVTPPDGVHLLGPPVGHTGFNVVGRNISTWNQFNLHQNTADAIYKYVQLHQDWIKVIRRFPSYQRIVCDHLKFICMQHQRHTCHANDWLTFAKNADGISYMLRKFDEEHYLLLVFGI